MILSKIFNNAEIARLMWPDDKFSKQRLNNKIKNISGQRLTDGDKNQIREIILRETEIILK